MAHGFLNGSRYDENNSSVVELIERTVVDAKIPAGVKTIGMYAFASCKNLKSAKIPSSVTSILNSAFHDCVALEAIDIPDSVTIIKGSVFHGCAGLKSIRLPQNLTVLDANLLYQCSSLTYVKIPPKIKQIFGSALRCANCLIFDFSDVEQVPTLSHTNAFLEILDEAKIFVPAHLYDEWVVATNWATYSDHIVAVYDAPEVVVPEGVSEGLDYTLGGDSWSHGYTVAGIGACTDSVLVIPSEHNGLPVTEFQECCFSGNTSIKEAYIPESIEYLRYAFSDCSVEKVYIDISSVNSFEFTGVASLKYAKFTRLINLGGGTFTGCTDAIFDFSECSAVPDFDSYGYGSEFGTNPTIMVPVELYAQWIADTNWSIYADHIVPVK